MGEVEKLTPEDFGFSKLEELMEEDWFQSRPPDIQKMIVKYPPIVLYKFKDSGKVVYLYSYCEDGTVTVIHLGYGTEFAFMSRNWKVFDVKPEALEALTPEESARIMNEVNAGPKPNPNLNANPTN